MKGVWTEETVERLLALNEQGMSAGAISRALGARASRNAVIGKLNRMGIGLKAGGLTPSKRATYIAKPTNSRPKPVKEVVSLAPEFIGPIGDFPKTGCKYTADDVALPGWKMCGQPVHAPGASWCDYHAFRGTPGVDLVFESQRTEASRQKGENADLYGAIQDRSMRRMGLG